MKCPYCSLDMILTLRCSMEVDECSQCEGIWLDGHKIKQLQGIKNSNNTLMKPDILESCNTGNINEEGTPEKDYYYYKVEFTENGYVDDLFGFEFK